MEGEVVLDQQVAVHQQNALARGVGALQLEVGPGVEDGEVVEAGRCAVQRLTPVGGDRAVAEAAGEGRTHSVGEGGIG